MDTSVPRQRDASDAALADMLTDAPVGLALFGSDMRFRWVNAALARLGGDAEAVPLSPEVPALSPEVPAVPAVQKPSADPSACRGLLPSEAWPAPVASRAEAALRKVLAEGAPLTESGYPAVSVAPGPLSADSGPGEEPPPSPGSSASPASAAEDVSGCASWFPVHDAGGQVFGVGLIVLNVAGPSAEAAEAAAAAAAAAAEIRRSEERYRSLVQGGAQVVWVAAPDGSMTEDSPEWRWITGQTQEQYAGFGWLDAVHPEDRERVERDWRECVRTGKILDDRYRIRTKNGSYRHYDVRAVPIERDGRIAEWVGASSDVTSQREAEEMRGRLTEQLSAAALRTARLQQATSMLAEALTVEQVVEVITEVGRTAIGALHSAVVLLDGARLRVVNDDLRNAPDSAGGELTLESPSVMTRAIATRRPVLVEDPEDLRRQFDGELEIDQERVAASDERSWVGLPLLAAGAPLGALRFSFARPRKITEEERVFLEALAGQCSLAVERAGLYEREHTTAETLQRSLLPDQLPTLPRLVLEATYRPVAKNMEIGGDWYDAFRLADQRLAVAVGDVMGKGLTAAAGMGRVRNALRALALTDPRPAAVLGGLDRLFAATEQEEQVTTVAYLVIDPETGDGVLGNAGHLPALVLEAGCAPRFDGVEAGTPLGWASPRKQHAFSLRPGSTAVFYSDGLVENRNRGLDAGLEELAAVAARADAELLARPGRFLEYLVERMLAGHEQDDDVTVLVMHVPAGGPR
ncbi:MAG TPA: SpoIIE family protein phosphatase [Streptosporangiaceae bacterium]|nr:SpoIIE family protein phosphatase [Streptosporangiaceae bacterium]